MGSSWRNYLHRCGLSILFKSIVHRKAWSEHCEKTRQFLLQTLNGDGQALHVLGAGRLTDFPLRELLERYESVYLYDGDSGAINYLTGLSNKYNRRSTSNGKAKIIVRQVELTGTLDQFERAVRDLNCPSFGVSDGEPSIKLVQTLLEKLGSSSSVRELLPFSPGCEIVSLNILSQLPLTHRELIERRLRKFHKVKNSIGAADKRYGGKDGEEEWLKEYNKLATKIIVDHLTLLNSSEAKRIIIISDSEQLFDDSVSHGLFPYSFPHPKEQHFSWEVPANIKSPLYVTGTTSGVEFWDKKTQAGLLSNYRQARSGYWRWHLTPGNSLLTAWVQKRTGIISRVDAIELIAKARAI